MLWYFDRPGFERHARVRPAFSDPLDSAPGKVLRGFVTGTSSGLGQAALARLRGLGHQVTGCSRRATEPGALCLDLADWGAVADAVEQLDVLDFVALNAGGMPSEFALNADGVELQFASQVFGHFLLAHNLVRSGRLRPGGRIVWMSSGGMYLARLHLRHLTENPRYDKITTYANVKRAQVVLNEAMAAMPLFADFGCYAMHPGWAETPGVEGSIPRFHRLTRSLLRDADQGADTLVWLAARQAGLKPALRSGAFYFDRLRTNTHLTPLTRESKAVREALLQALRDRLRPYLA